VLSALLRQADIVCVKVSRVSNPIVAFIFCFDLNFELWEETVVVYRWYTTIINKINGGGCFFESGVKGILKNV